jgi:hypothetical protein
LLFFSIRGRSVTAASVAISISILLEAIFFFFLFLIFFFGLVRVRLVMTDDLESVLFFNVGKIQKMPGGVVLPDLGISVA